MRKFVLPAMVAAISCIAPAQCELGQQVISNQDEDSCSPTISTYNILWYRNDIFRRYESPSFPLANAKWNAMTQNTVNTSRIFLNGERIYKSWFRNESSRLKLMEFVESEGLHIEPHGYPDRMYYTAFSHRDSDCDDPLFGALTLGVGNIEFDVHCIDSELLIGHDEEHCTRDITIQSMYLDPLRTEIESNRLKHPIHLFVDFKTEAKESYAALHKLIENEYSDLVTFWEWNADTQSVVKHSKMINVIVTGNRDMERIQSTPNEEEMQRFMAMDGRIEDLDSDEWDENIMPMISDRFGKVFPNGDVLDEMDKLRLNGYIDKCRERGQKLRFWETRDDTQVWRQLLDLDVDGGVVVINTDDYRMLISFLARDDI